ncbi:glutaminase [Granulosicoccus sp.]|nr:glutaminase [Granulosicoccus sp.]MDB4224803.1 glutaminase [Granulosicoccus sp.]
MNSPDYQHILQGIKLELHAIEDLGRVASYIPELANVNPKKFGAHLVTVEGQNFCTGDSEEKFSIQSISKVLSLTLALQNLGDELWQRLDVEPSGSAYNSLVQLELEKGFPRNPFINAGAIVVCDALIGCLNNPKQDILQFVRSTSGVESIDYCPRVLESERRTGFNNYALANLMKGFGNLHHDVDDVLDVYFHLCSIEMSCRQLAETFLFLASGGLCAATGEQLISAQRARRINSIMQMCGFYDEAGEFAFRVGLPGKSGVGGGIVAVHPGKYSVAVWSPGLNAKGNSYKGMKMLEAITTQVQSSIF